MADKFLQVLVANECIHSRFKARNPGLMCKLDLKKIYDRVEWEYSKIRITLIKAANVMLYYMPLFKCPTVISNRIEHCNATSIARQSSLEEVPSRRLTDGLQTKEGGPGFRSMYQMNQALLGNGYGEKVMILMICGDMF